MKYRILLILLFLNNVINAETSFRIDKETCIVAIPDRDDSLVVNLATAELQYFIRSVVGINIPVFRNVNPKYKRHIYIGKNALSAGEKKIDYSWGEQEYLIKILSDRIFLVGNDKNNDGIGRDNIGVVPQTDRVKINYGKALLDNAVNEELLLPSIYDAQGTCYAVYDFIERFLGVRFYGPHPDNVIIPNSSILKIKPQTIRRSPVFKFRQGTFSFDWPIMKEQFFSANRDMQQLFIRRLRMGGRRYAANHAFVGYQDRFLKKNPQCPESFEAYHPEYFAKGRSGGASELQFCYTNQNFINQVIKDAIRYFKEQGIQNGQIALGDYFAVVPLDNANWCTCEECQKQLLWDKNNILGQHFNNGTATHYIWNFINQVAKGIQKECPGKKISTLAYHVYAYPPKDIKLENNIVVAPCLHPRNYWALGMERNEMKLYKEWVSESLMSGRELYLWNYLCFPTERGLVNKFNVFPGFNIHKTGELLCMYAKDKIQGIFLCGIGEQLDFYITMKLMDDPNLGVDNLLNEFFEKYFEEASAEMKNFYFLIEEVYSSSKNYPKEVQKNDAQFHQTEEIAWKYLGTPKIMNQLATFIDKAESCAKNYKSVARFNSWKQGVWQYMIQGYKHYYNNDTIN